MILIESEEQYLSVKDLTHFLYLVKAVEVKVILDAENKITNKYKYHFERCEDGCNQFLGDCCCDEDRERDYSSPYDDEASFE